jgi:hypothetical protein
MSNKSRSQDKRGQYWTSIMKEKLDTLRWTMLHSGLNVAGLQDDDGHTGLQLAAANDKAKAMLVMLDTLRSKRELVEAIDVPDEAGRTPLMLAAIAGSSKCVDHLLYYGASITRKSAEGMTARDYAVKHKKGDVVAVFDEEAEANAPGAASSGPAEEAVDADGLTSTQRNKLKKKQLKEAERKGVMAAVTAAAASLPAGGEEDEDGGAPRGGAGGASSDGGAAAAAAAPLPFGMPHLPSPAPKPRWPEVQTVMDEKRRELTINKGAPAVGGAGSAEAPAGGEAAAAAATAGGDLVDPAVWHCSLLNRLQLQVPGLSVLSPLVGHLTALQTLILAGNALVALPDSIGALVELKALDVSRNAIAELPLTVGKLTKLEVLNLDGNKLASLAPLAPLTSLLTLTADRNEITDIPLNFEGLARLDTLSLSHNKLAELPDDIGKLAALAVLNVAENELTELPAGECTARVGGGGGHLARVHMPARVCAFLATLSHTVATASLTVAPSPLMHAHPAPAPRAKAWRS